jgi:hypothetical protein
VPARRLRSACPAACGCHSAGPARLQQAILPRRGLISRQRGGARTHARTRTTASWGEANIVTGPAVTSYREATADWVVDRLYGYHTARIFRKVSPHTRRHPDYFPELLVNIEDDPVIQRARRRDLL